MRKRGIPTQDEINGILFNEKECKSWLMHKKIILRERHCEICQKSIYLNASRESYRHRCLTGDVEMSMWKNTLFSRSKLRPSQIMNLLYHWLIGANHGMLMALGGHSDDTITQLIRDANNMVSSMLEENDTKIGGPNIIIEIDESKLSKRKYNRGHHVEGTWVIGGVERTIERKFFAVQVENRNSLTISQIIKEHVYEGSIIYTDCWKGYNYLDETDEYIHGKVNHSLNFKDPETGIHTNSIEGTWAAVKSKIPKRYRCKEGLEDHINAFIWRRQNEGRLWEALLHALTDYHWLE
jgi:transposase-like protein